MSVFSIWLPIEVGLKMKMMKILECRVWTRRNIVAFVVNINCATNAHFQKKTTKIPGWKAGKFVAYCVPYSKEPFEQGTQYSIYKNPFAVSGLKAPFSLFRSRKNVLYFEPARAYYICMNHRC